MKDMLHSVETTFLTVEIANNQDPSQKLSSDDVIVNQVMEVLISGVEERLLSLPHRYDQVDNYQESRKSKPVETNGCNFEKKCTGTLSETVYATDALYTVGSITCEDGQIFNCQQSVKMENRVTCNSEDLSDNKEGSSKEIVCCTDTLKMTYVKCFASDTDKDEEMDKAEEKSQDLFAHASKEDVERTVFQPQEEWKKTKVIEGNTDSQNLSNGASQKRDDSTMMEEKGKENFTETKEENVGSRELLTVDSQVENESKDTENEKSDMQKEDDEGMKEFEGSEELFTRSSLSENDTDGCVQKESIEDQKEGNGGSEELFTRSSMSENGTDGCEQNDSNEERKEGNEGSEELFTRSSMSESDAEEYAERIDDRRKDEHERSQDLLTRPSEIKEEATRSMKSPIIDMQQEGRKESEETKIVIEDFGRECDENGIDGCVQKDTAEERKEGNGGSEELFTRSSMSENGTVGCVKKDGNDERNEGSEELFSRSSLSQNDADEYMERDDGGKDEHERSQDLLTRPSEMKEGATISAESAILDMQIESRNEIQKVENEEPKTSEETRMLIEVFGGKCDEKLEDNQEEYETTNIPVPLERDENEAMENAILHMQIESRNETQKEENKEPKTSEETRIAIEDFGGKCDEKLEDNQAESEITNIHVPLEKGENEAMDIITTDNKFFRQVKSLQCLIKIAFPKLDDVRDQTQKNPSADPLLTEELFSGYFVKKEMYVEANQDDIRVEPLNQTSGIQSYTDNEGNLPLKFDTPEDKNSISRNEDALQEVPSDTKLRIDTCDDEDCNNKIVSFTNRPTTLEVGEGANNVDIILERVQDQERQIMSSLNISSDGVNDSILQRHERRNSSTATISVNTENETETLKILKFLGEPSMMSKIDSERLGELTPSFKTIHDETNTKADETLDAYTTKTCEDDDCKMKNNFDNKESVSVENKHVTENTNIDDIVSQESLGFVTALQYHSSQESEVDEPCNDEVKKRKHEDDVEDAVLKRCKMETEELDDCHAVPSDGSEIGITNEESFYTDTSTAGKSTNNLKKKLIDFDLRPNIFIKSSVKSFQ